MRGDSRQGAKGTIPKGPKDGGPEDTTELVDKENEENGAIGASVRRNSPRRVLSSSQHEANRPVVLQETLAANKKAAAVTSSSNVSDHYMDSITKAKEMATTAATVGAAAAVAAAAAKGVQPEDAQLPSMRGAMLLKRVDPKSGRVSWHKRHLETQGTLLLISRESKLVAVISLPHTYTLKVSPSRQHGL